ncbi:MAG: hypothetical protein EOO13_11140 [Chitinophagaceae bacterium]|nr:MAG: hypothetical protein EOO13_11140 [Chitinophagaceae bacterium]
MVKVIFSNSKIYKMKTILSLLCFFSAAFTYAQSPVGKWKKISHVSSYEGQTFDSHKALLQSRPCAAKVIWEINEDGTFRQNLEASGCDESYKKIQTKMYSQSVWKLAGNKLFIGGKEGIGQNYTISISGNKLVMTGTDGQGTITYQKS